MKRCLYFAPIFNNTWPSRQIAFGKLSELIKLERKEISSIYFYAILNGLVQLSLPLGIQAIIGFVLGATMVTSVYVLIFFVVLGTLVVGILNIYQMKIIEKIQQKIFVRYTFNMGLKIPGFDLLSIDKYYLPDKINYFFDILTVQKGISKLLLDIPIATIQIILGLVLLSFYHPLFIVFGFCYCLYYSCYCVLPVKAVSIRAYQKAIINTL